MLFSQLERNYTHGKQLIAKAMEEKPDVIVLPETWTTGFFPKRNIEEMCDDDGKRVKAEIGALAKQYGVNIVAIADGKPMQLGLIALLDHFINHQKNVVTRRTQYDLDQAKARAHIVEGLIRAVDVLDEVIKTIRASKNGKEARTRLCEQFGFTEIQAQAILDLRLQRLTGLEILALREEFAQLQKKIAEFEGILKSERKLLNVIKKELGEIGEQFKDARRTQILKDDKTEELLKEDQDDLPVPEEDMEEIVSWLYAFQVGNRVGKNRKNLVPGTGSVEMTLTYADGTSERRSLDIIHLDGVAYLVKYPNAPQCYVTLLNGS